jgi:hypothetical protein
VGSKSSNGLMTDEILNIDYHVRRLVVKALNLFPTKLGASKALGISERQLYTYIKQYDIYRDSLFKKYTSKQNLLHHANTAN